MPDEPADSRTDATEAGDAASADDAAAPEAGEERSGGATADEVEQLLSRAEAGLEEASGPAGDAAQEPSGGEATAEDATPFSLPELQPPADSGGGSPSPIDLLGDVELDLRIELGRTHMRLEEVLQLRGGSVVALDKLAGDPVDVFVNGRMIARGEVLVLNDNFCIRVTELISRAG